MYAETEATIRKSPLFGSAIADAEILVHDDLLRPQDLALDFVNSKLYWIDNLPNSSCVIGVYDLKSRVQSQFGPAIKNCASFSIDFSVVSFFVNHIVTW